MIKGPIVLALFMLIGGNLRAQEVSEYMHQIVGQWSGALTYLDYSDDISQTTLNCKMKASWNNNKGTISIGFEEPNGKVIYDKAKIKLFSDQERVKFDGVVYKIDSYSSDPSGDQWTLVLIAEGQDNYKPAMIRQSIVLEVDNLSLVKEIKYEGSAAYFTRNSYSFNKL